MPWDDQLSEEQRAIVLTCARLKVIRASPGSGKTRLFVATLQRGIETWQTTKSGIAALSYTNVARNEIGSRIGLVAPPHLVSTIDSFILRFIVRPFAHLVNVAPSGAVLVPAAVAERLDIPAVIVGARNNDRASLYQVSFTGENNGVVALSARTSYRVRAVLPGRQDEVLRQKERLWRTTGHVTHSDTHYLAYKILSDPRHGLAIAQCVARRFPVILLDEYQDTNYFLARAFCVLFARPEMRGMAVGDPDQAIFEFGGAHPELFNDLDGLPGARPFRLEQSHRCPEAIMRIARVLSVSRQPIASRGNGGTVAMVVHNVDRDEVPQGLAELTRELVGERAVTILARRHATLHILQGGHGEVECPAESRTISQLDRAVRLLSVNLPLAVQLATAEVCRLRFGENHPRRDVLDAAGVTKKAVKGAAFRVLVGLSEERDAETWRGWMTRAKVVMWAAAVSLGMDEADRARLGRMIQARGDIDAVRTLLTAPVAAPPWPERTNFDTVHGVKGENHEAVMLYYPRPANRDGSRCPSTEWWNPASFEEQRIAFVAATRVEHVFILCVHRETYQALARARADFCAGFDIRFL